MAIHSIQRKVDAVPRGHGFDMENDKTAVTLPSAPTFTGSERSSASASASASVYSAASYITGQYSNIASKYDVRREHVLGTGFTASVTECTDRATGAKYAVKSVRKRDRHVRTTDLHREVELLREVEHDNVVRLVDVFEDAEHVHLVTDLYSGGELYDEIARRKKSGDAGCFEEADAARVLRQVLEAVSYLHERDIVHRDIKPENILYESEGDDSSSSVRLVDFGVARKHYPDSLQEYMYDVVGTPYFLAPEVLKQKYDRRCDLWSVGVVAYILLSGRPPFGGRSNREVCQAIKRGKYAFDSRHWKGVSGEAKDFVKKLLQANPRRRMTAEQALKHPWIVKHNTVDTVKEKDEEDPQGKCVGAASFKKLRQKESAMSFRGISQCKLKLSMFRI